MQSGWRTTGLEWDFSDIYVQKDHLGIGRNYAVPFITFGMGPDFYILYKLSGVAASAGPRAAL